MNISETRFPSQECFNDKKKEIKKKKRKENCKKRAGPLIIVTDR